MLLFFSVCSLDSLLIRGIYNSTKKRMKDKDSEGKNVFAKECNVLMQYPMKCYGKKNSLKYIQHRGRLFLKPKSKQFNKLDTHRKTVALKMLRFLAMTFLHLQDLVIE